MAIISKEALDRYNFHGLTGYMDDEMLDRRRLGAWLCGVGDLVANSRYDDDIVKLQVKQFLSELESLQKKVKENAKK